MKTQIIQLEIHDDTISVKDRMDWSQAPRVLLIWPERGKVMKSRLDLVLLERYCSAHGSQLAILTTELEVRYQAEEAGIPVFQSRNTAQLQSWRKSFREFRRREVEQQASEPRDYNVFDREERPIRREVPVWVRITLFTVSVLAVIAIGAILLPSAVVFIIEEEIQQEIVIPVIADPTAKEINISGIIPSREIVVLLDQTASLTTSGQIPLPDEYAQGEVLFTNLTDEPIDIPKNTILSTEGEYPILFVTLSPRKTTGEIGEQSVVRIQALEAGTSGNILAGQITRINQAFGADLSVKNVEPTTGGTDSYIPAPNQKDRDSLSSSVTEEMQELALVKIQEQLSSEDFLLNPDLIRIEIIQNEFSPSADSMGDTLTLTRKARYYMDYISGKDLKTLASNFINARYLGEDIKPIMESLRLTQLSNPVSGSNHTFIWDLGIIWNEIRQIPEHEVIQLVLGEEPADAEKILEQSLDLKETPQIILSPNWWFRLPALPFRINVIQEGG
ncbi:MAG: baseplate J/gp47 family protein [Anaerolineales bacterium]